MTHATRYIVVTRDRQDRTRWYVVDTSCNQWRGEYIDADYACADAARLNAENEG